MASPESFVINKAVAERTAAMAEKAGAEETASVLSRLLLAEGLGLPVNAAMKGAASILGKVKELEVQEKREAGKLNDLTSTSIGLTALVTPSFRWIWKTWSQANSKPAETLLNDQSRPVMSGIDDESDMLSVRMPSGAFEQINEQIIFIYPGAVLDEDGTVVFRQHHDYIGSLPPVSLPVDQVLRIEGDQGDLWVNPDHAANT